MNPSRKIRHLWWLWLALNLTGGAFLVYKVFPGENKTLFLPGETTHGHYQIEMSCDECHTAFMGVKQDSCIRCHGEELELAQDAHPASKFSDPTDKHMLEKVDATQCIACHTEHNPDATHTMGVTLPTDYCAFCHEDVGENRKSHAGLGFDTCADAGCHNFHDNRALYERFLRDHVNEPDHLPTQKVPELTGTNPLGPALTEADQDAPTHVSLEGSHVTDWLADAHAKNGVNCSDCHTPKGGNDSQPADPGTPDWIAKPNHQVCASCHQDQHTGWTMGRHGMRVASGLSPMQPGMARLDMHAGAAHQNLSCNSCHKSHRYDTQFAAMDACLQCHSDPHSLAYKNSGHARLWQREVSGKAPAGTGVSCATCHMPRTRESDGPITVQHNQNDNLRPNEKMIRSSCMNCHGVGFSLDALADPALVASCFDAPASVHVETMDWVKTRIKEIEERRARTAEKRAKREKERAEQEKNRPKANQGDL